MFITKKHIPRRAFLRTALGGAVALPLLDAMIPALTAQSKTAAKPQLRFGGSYVPNGVLPDRWHPSTTGRDFEFKPAMKPLEPFRDMLFTVSGMVGSGNPGPHLGASCGWLNGLGAVGKQGAPIVSGKSLDQFIADKIGQDTPMPSIEVGTEDMGTSLGACDGFACTYFNAVSWKSDTSPRPVEINPACNLRTDVRRDRQQPASAFARLEYKGSMLDSLTQEVARLRGQLAPRDQHILGDYLENVREVERRIQLVMKRSESSVEAPTAPTGVPESFAEHMTLTSMTLMHIAFQGDISRVFTFLTGVEASNRGYAFIGVPESHHVCSHHGNDPVMMDKYTKIVTWQAQQFANFAKKLQATPDGDGSLLDHSLLYFGGGHEQWQRPRPPARPPRWF